MEPPTAVYRAIPEFKLDNISPHPTLQLQWIAGEFKRFVAIPSKCVESPLRACAASGLAVWGERLLQEVIAS
jgi:hypothetical protein